MGLSWTYLYLYGGVLLLDPKAGESLVRLIFTTLRPEDRKSLV